MSDNLATFVKPVGFKTRGSSVSLTGKNGINFTTRTRFGMFLETIVGVMDTDRRTDIVNKGVKASFK